MTQLELTRSAAHARMLDGFEALERDLVHADGPRISTMRAYRFALLQYDPALEYEQRQAAQALGRTLVDSGWYVVPISLQQLVFDRIRREPGFADAVAEMEKDYALDPYDGSFDEALTYLGTKLEPLIEGVAPDRGLAGDVSTLIGEHVGAHPDRKDRMLVLIGRVGALYPFFRVSSLLRHLDGHTHGVPVVILYPGTRDIQTPNALSFMGVLPGDSDYRPRIYP